MFKRLAQGDTRSAVSAVAQTNPAFARFLQENQGRPIEQAFADYGLDLPNILSALSQTR